jgi:hypothetical protein
MEVVDGFNFNIRYNYETNNLDMEFVIPDGTWFGIVFGAKSMVNADIIQVRADGVNSRFTELYGRGLYQPGIKTNIIINGTATNSEKEVTFKISRPLTTTDAEHFALQLDTQTTFGWAANRNSNDPRNKHTVTGGLKVFVPSDGSLWWSVGGSIATTATSLIASLLLVSILL